MEKKSSATCSVTVNTSHCLIQHTRLNPHGHQHNNYPRSIQSTTTKTEPEKI